MISDLKVSVRAKFAILLNFTFLRSFDKSLGNL